MNALLDKLIARLCSGALSRFRKMPIHFLPADIASLKFSFSQFGEDLVIFEELGVLGPKPRGIYVDAGCYDPHKFSNTRLLNLLGWNGINIDAAPQVVEKFRKVRPKDHNVCAALSSSSVPMRFVGAPGSATSRLAADGDEGLPVRTTTLAEILLRSPFAKMAVDLLDIDCEGHDFDVLRGFPFDSVRPAVICIEAHLDTEQTNIASFLRPRDYRFVGGRGPSLIYRHSIAENPK